MNQLVILLGIFFIGGLLVYVADKIHKILAEILVALIGIGAAVYFFAVDLMNVSLEWKVLEGVVVSLGFNAYSWLFAMMVAILTPLALVYSLPYMHRRDRLGWFYMLFLFSVGSMFGILLARDWISLFIFWEIMTWSSYLIVIYYRDIEPNRVGLKYLVFSAIGAYAMFTAIVVIGQQVGSFMLEDLFSKFGELSLGNKLLISLLLLLGFGVKAAVMPMHVWAPDAYSSAPMSFTSVFSGALSKMGVYGIGLVVLKLLLEVDLGIVGVVLAWLGAITAVLATFYAIVQDDAKRLLAWSSVAQLGYIVAGIGIGTKLAVFAALYLAILHAAFKATLFMAVGAIEMRAGTTKFSELRALIRRMPYTFFAALVAVIALAGVPPLGGFVGKWMLYEAMITDGHYVVVILFFLASTAAFLYSYRILFGLFLGQEEKEFASVREASPLMVIPMLILAFFLVITGTLPGFVFNPIAKAMEQNLGFSDVTYHMSILTNNWGDSIDLRHVTLALGASFVVFLIIITVVNWKGTRYVSTKDIHTSGEPPSEEDNYHFALDFFKPFQRAIEPVYKYMITEFYYAIGRLVEDTMQFVRRFYTGNAQTYAIYVLLFLALLLLFADKIF